MQNIYSKSFKAQLAMNDLAYTTAIRLKLLLMFAEQYLTGIVKMTHFLQLRPIRSSILYGVNQKQR